ncbi:MAG: hypothetical protein HYX87_02180 [Chloroflexi bacterium]|nr:hypothetical protein [Chloroflexota bacterium]
MASPVVAAQESARLPMSVRVMEGKLENVYKDVQFGKLGQFLNTPSHTWIDISSVSDADFDQLSSSLDIPRMILESELVDDSYPRVDYFQYYSMIFARVADVSMVRKDPARLLVNRSGLLVICKGPNMVTLSKTRTHAFDQILEKAKKIHTPGEPVVVSILYALIKHILEQDRQIVTMLELELMALESIPLKDRPSNFLETTFHLRKEVNQLVPSLLHLKEIISMIASKRVPLDGFSDRHEKVFGILVDEASYLHETASNARDNLASLIDLYINTTSFETNKVMRIIAVITSLGIIPALMGLFGSNIIGNPWDIHLWQLFAGIGTTMLALGWVFYRLGWLKG